MRSRLCMSVVVTVGVLAPGWALADAANIKQSIETYLKDKSVEMEGAQVTYDDLTVTEKGDLYDVIFKGLAVKGDEGFVVDIGDSSFTLGQNGDDYDISNLKVADSITFKHEKEPETAVLSWKVNKAAGTWSPAVEEFKAIDLQIADVTVTVEDGGEDPKQMVATLGDILLKGTTEVIGDENWNQSGSVKLGPIDVEDPEGDGTLKIGAFEVVTDVNGFNPKAYREQVVLMDELEAAHEAGDQAKVQEIKDKMQDIALLAEGGQAGVVFKDVDFQEHRGDKVHFVMEETSIVFDASAPKGAETGSMGLALMGVGAKYKSDDLHGEDQLAAMVAPENWDVNVELSNLPVKETSQAIVELLFAGIGIQDEPMIPFPQIMAAMGKAGSEVLVDSLSLVGPLASLDGNAKATVDPASAMGAIGGATLKLIGLAKLEAALGDLPKDMQQDIAGGLVFLKGLGTPEPDGDDVNYVYVFDVPADGNITLNGQPMGALLGN